MPNGLIAAESYQALVHPWSVGRPTRRSLALPHPDDGRGDRQASDPRARRVDPLSGWVIPFATPGSCGTGAADRQGHGLHRARLALENPFPERFNGRTRDQLLGPWGVHGPRPEK